MSKSTNILLSSAVSAALLTPAFSSLAQPDSERASRSVGIEEVVVTAQKRSESANEVGMSITALGGERLSEMGVTNPQDLTKVIPGFVAFEAPRGTPIYSIRGIGFDDSSLAANPTVASYVDEVPLVFPVMGRFSTLDLERVEVLKGPQGILFGQNSTAGAINFIAAKPTDHFAAGLDLSYGRFERKEVAGYISGPVHEDLNLRFAAKTIQASEGWQKSYTRSDKLGEVDQFAARFLAEWTPANDVRVMFNVNGWIDKSDTLASQLIEAQPTIPPTANPYLEFYPRAPRNARAADWKPDFREKLARDDSFIQGSVRVEYDISSDITLTSITAYSDYRQEFTQDTDGTDAEAFILTNKGDIEAFDQELRLTGQHDRMTWIAGANYGKYNTFDSSFYNYHVSSSTLGFLGIGDALAFTKQPIETYAVFGNIDYSVNDVVTLHAGLRYTKDDRNSTGCTVDPDTDGVFRNAFNTVIGITGTPLEIGPGGCTTSTIIDGVRTPTLVYRALDEDNISWRVGIDFQLNPDVLVYVNATKGYKSGGFPAVNTADASQLESVVQESVLAYEGGFKAGLFDRKIQLNGAAFYYDYSDKQLRGRILDTSGFFGVLEALVNIPESEVYGAELSMQAAPLPGLLVNLGATYVHSEVTETYFNYDPAGNLINYKGLEFPHTPEWNYIASVDYVFDLADSYEMFFGVNAVYQSSTSGLFHDKDILGATQPSPISRPGVFWDRNAFKKRSFMTVDARIGVGDIAGKWKAWIFGRNIFNEYYWNNVTQTLDTSYRQAAMPRTYGVQVSYDF